MKLSSIGKLLILLLTTASISNSYAQKAMQVPENNYQFIATATSVTPDHERDFFNNSIQSKIDLKIVREFAKRFGILTNVKWFKTNEGTHAYFTKDGIKTRVAFSQKGKWLYNLKSFGERQLPTEVRAQVKSMYYDFSITGVDEIVNPHQKSYVVHLKDEKGWTNLRWCNGEMEEVEILSEQLLY